jgi:hypothetical protein
VKPKPKVVNKPSHHSIRHGLDKPGVFTTVSHFPLDPLALQCLPARRHTYLIQEVDKFVQYRALFQAIDGVYRLLLPQPSGYPALITPGEPPIQSLHQIRRDVFFTLHRWPPSAYPSSYSGRPTSRQADSLCWNFRMSFVLSLL